MKNIKNNTTANTNNVVNKEETEMKTIATPNNTTIVVIEHNKYGNKTFRAFGAYTVKDANGKKQYIPAHLEARGIGTEKVAKIAFNEFVRKAYGATIFFQKDIKGVREGCYFKEVTAEKKTAPSVPAPVAAPTVPEPVVTKGIRVLVTGTDTSVLEDVEFKRELATIVRAAQAKGATMVEFVNNGSLGTAFIELGVRMNAGYKSKWLKVWTSIVADGVHEGFFAHVDVGTPEPEKPAPAPQPQQPEPSPEKPEEKSEPDEILESIAAKVKAMEEQEEEDDLEAVNEPSSEEKPEEVPESAATEAEATNEEEKDDDLGALADPDTVPGEIEAYEKANPGCKVRVPERHTIVCAYYEDKTNKLECKVVGPNGKYNMNVYGPEKEIPETPAPVSSAEGVSFFDACSVEREEEPDNGWNDEDIENMDEAEFAFHCAIADIIDGREVMTMTH